MILSMSIKQPPEVREKRALLSRKRYYKLLGDKCAEYGISPDVAFLVHSASLQVIGQELNRNGVVRVPHIGTIAMVERAPGPAWYGQARVHAPARKTLRITPDRLLKLIYNKKQNHGLSIYRHTRDEVFPENRHKIIHPRGRAQ